MNAALTERGKAWVRFPITVIASGLLWTLVSAPAGALWLIVMLSLEAGAAAIRSRLSQGASELGAPYLAITAAISIGWIVQAVLLWGASTETAHIAAIVGLFSVALYGAVGAHQDKRILAILLGPQLVTLAVLLLDMAWSDGLSVSAIVVSVASIGAAGTVALNGWKLNAAAAHLRETNLALEKERRSLEARVRDRTRDLERATHEAQSASRAKSAFLATMSHELRTPLNAILGYADLLDEQLAAGETPASADVAKIKHAGAQLLRLVENVLHLTTLEAGADAPALSDVDPRVLVDTTVAGFKDVAEARGNHISTALESALQHIKTDPQRLRLGLTHLLDNACKFTRNGAIVVRARRSVDPAWAIELIVEDTGEGMPPEMAARVGAAFEQGAGGFDRRHDGAGLGLAITRRLIESLGGDLTIQSELGRGTKAIIRLPDHPRG